MKIYNISLFLEYYQTKGRNNDAHPSFLLDFCLACDFVQEPQNLSTLSRLYTTTLLLLVACTVGFAQQELLSEDFNGCSLPAGWTAEATGNPDAIWYVGQPQNTNSDGSTIDGSCMLIFDDDGTGENTPAWTASLESPTFDGTGWESLRLSMDVHFRNYNGSAKLEVMVFDGSEYQLVAAYQGAGSQTGEQFSEFVTLTADLSFFAHPDMRLLVRYDEGDDWAWWAAVDNIRIVGEGEGIPILTENFDDCSLPIGWASETITGDFGWTVGYSENPNAEGSSMNGSCFAFFDDDAIGIDATPSRVLLFSPVIDGTVYAQLKLEYDLILRTAVELENLSVGVQDMETNNVSWVVTYLGGIGGPEFYDYINESLDITPYRSASMRLVFQYEDGGGWGWWAGIDNVKVSGQGLMNDLCTNALPVYLNDDCLSGNNELALFTGQPPACANAVEGSLWYEYQAQSTGLVRITTNADYNDAITVFAGDCDAPSAVACTNFDAFGFTGEQLIFEAEADNTYYIRTSGLRGAFGLSRGAHCIALESVSAYPEPPTNDLCGNALPLIIDGDCVTANNYHATFSGPMPSLNDKSESDVWFQFTTTTSEGLAIETAADFADVITLYQGDCGGLTEVACADLGQVLDVETVEPNTTYFVQVSSYYPTLYGNLCAAVRTLSDEQPANMECVSATAVSIGGACVTASNVGAEFSGPASSCDVYLSSSVWFSFVAPESGKMYIETDADFIHALSIFTGSCNDMEEVFCATNPNDCNGNALAQGLVPGETYLLRVSSSADPAGIWGTGDLCLRLSEPNEPIEDYMPLSVSGGLDCYGNGTAQLSYFIVGGTGAYEIAGNGDGEVLAAGSSYLVIVTDENGCSTSFAGTVECAQTCALAAEAIVLNGNECPEDYQGEVMVNVSGGEAPYQYVWSNGSTASSLDDLPSGDYTITVSDSTGTCTAIATASVPGPPPFDFDILSILQPTGNWEDDGQISVSINGGTPPYEYSWMLDGDIGMGDTPTITNLIPGSYVCTITDADGCIFVSAPIVLPFISSTAEVTDWLYCQLFPNPTRQLVNLTWQSSGAEVEQISMYNLAGQRVLALPVSSSSEGRTIDVSRYAAGLYLIRLHTSKGTLVKRLMVE